MLGGENVAELLLLFWLFVCVYECVSMLWMPPCVRLGVRVKLVASVCN